MGWLSRIFGKKEEEKAQKPENQKAVQQNTKTQAAPATTATQAIAPERMGLDGEYDQSGLAKRVAFAFDQDSQIDDIETVWVAQTNSTVVLKGKVPNQQILDKMVSVAKGVKGATAVDTTQVSVG